MGATYRSASGENITADVTGHSCVLPAGVQAGDFLLYWFVGNGHSITSFDTDYPQIGSRQEGGNADMTCFGGVYTGTAPVVDINVVDPPDGNLGVIAVQKSGGGTLTLDQNSPNGPSSGTSHATSSITPGFDDSCVVAMFGGEALAQGAASVDGGFTKRRDAEYYGLSVGATLDQGTAASAQTTMTSTVSEAAVHRIVSVYEAGGGGGGGQPPRTLHQARLRRAS